MWLQHLELVDFRSYAEARVELPRGVSVLVGPNAQGKTNLVEAVQRLATGSSHRVASDGPLVRVGASDAVVRVVLETDEQRRRTIEARLGGRSSRLRVDGQDVRRAADALGVLRAVLFAPEDLSIVRGDPTERRRFLDGMLAQRRPAFGAARAEYERALRQRNRLLKGLRTLGRRERDEAQTTLDVWTDQLVASGAQIMAARLAAIQRLQPLVDGLYQDLADRADPIRITYESSVSMEVAADAVPAIDPIVHGLQRAFADVAVDELRRGITLIGPHRDDVALTIGSMPARGYSSHGEAWSLALALKLATHDLLADIGDRPIVLLDDVFAELDATRRARLADACDAFDQVVVTAAVEDDVPLTGARFDVSNAAGGSEVVPREVTGACA